MDEMITLQTTDIALPPAQFKIMGNTFKVLYVSDLHIDWWLDDRKKTMDELIKDIFNYVPKNTFIDFIVIAGDLSRYIECAREFFEILCHKMHHHEGLMMSKIFYILGNHELSCYDTMKECYSVYHELEKRFHRLTVLTNQVYPYVSTCMSPSDISFGRDKDYPSCFVLGGVGFSRFNEIYNADTLIYSRDIAGHHEDVEIPECEKFYKLYKTTLEKAKKLNIPLIVITHIPVYDWLPAEEIDSQCVYFYGHNHHSEYRHSKDAFIVANNQIGYPVNKKGEKSKNKIRFKYIEMEKAINPFRQYKDGYYQVLSEEYKQYCDYIGLHVEGVKTIQKQLDKGGILWMIKQSEYYGFFVTAKTKTYICRGGTLKTISNETDIQYFINNFPLMILGIIKFCTPYYTILQQISEKIKAAGLWGTIHGCIVDIDYSNHIAINPFDGTITRYNSCCVGDAIVFDSLLEMKKYIPYYYNRMSDLEKRNFKKIETTLKSISNNALIDKEKQLPATKTCEVSYNNSIYPVSRGYLLLERLLDSYTLQYWNDELLQNIHNITAEDAMKYIY